MSHESHRKLLMSSRRTNPECRVQEGVVVEHLGFLHLLLECVLRFWDAERDSELSPFWGWYGAARRRLEQRNGPTMYYGPIFCTISSGRLTFSIRIRQEATHHRKTVHAFAGIDGFIPGNRKCRCTPSGVRSRYAFISLTCVGTRQ